MNRSTTLTIAAILAAAVIGFFIGRAFPAKQATQLPDKAKKEIKKVSNSPSEKEATLDEETAKSDNSKTTDLEEAKNNATEKPQPDEGVAKIETGVNPLPTEVPKIDKAILGRVNMGISDDKISEVLSAISKNMERKKLAYVSSLSQDCSGIYHQIKDSLQARLPVLRESATYHYPKYNTDRSSRQIADWYHKNNNLLIVKDPMASRNSIRPGSVMFFGRSGEIFRDLTIEKLTDSKNNYTKNGAIQHVAVVTSIKKDKEGNVKEYTMMHARYPEGPHASRSGSKEVQSNSAKNKAKVAPYPFGHWTQQWVGIANIATPRPLP